MTKFTKEEISLYKQVAEKYRKEIKSGDWVIEGNRMNIPLLVIDTIGDDLFLSLGNIAHRVAYSKNCIPLWNISDSLEFLNKHGWNAITLSWRMEQVGDKPEIAYCEITHDNFYEAEEKKALNHVKDFEAKTILEALLLAVLAVLKEGK